MARKKIREYDSKRMLKEHIARLAGVQLPLRAAQVHSPRGKSSSMHSEQGLLSFPYSLMLNLRIKHPCSAMLHLDVYAHLAFALCKAPRNEFATGAGGR